MPFATLVKIPQHNSLVPGRQGLIAGCLAMLSRKKQSRGDQQNIADGAVFDTAEYVSCLNNLTKASEHL